MRTKLATAILTTLCLAIALAAFSAAVADEKGGVDDSLRALGYTIVPLRKTATNEFEVTATLNGGKSISLLVSFQAYTTIFNTQRLDEIGVKYEKTGREFEVNGDDGDMFMLRTDSTTIGDGKIGQEEIMCIDFSEFSAFDDYRVTGMLGRDFLIKYNAIIDFANQKLYLKTRN
jgi:hypothetical protein